jgi:hypothetical protein
MEVLLLLLPRFGGVITTMGDTDDIIGFFITLFL